MDERTQFGWTIGEEVMLDNKVRGKVHGFYDGQFVVFEPEWAWGRGVWGRLDRKDEPSEDSVDIKHTFLSLMLVHPSNLSAPSS